jgi:hypothetical protein
VREVRVHLLVLFRQRDPDLNAIEFLAPFSQLVIGALGVRDAASGGHPVNRAGLDGLHAAEAVPVNDGALEQIGHGGKTDVRMRSDVDPETRRQLSRSHLVEENERTDIAPLRRRQYPADFKSSDVARPRHHDSFQRPARRRQLRLGFFSR